MRKRIDLAGQRFGRLVVLGRVGTIRGRSAWECVCDCGNTTTVASDLLIRGDTQSCGCLRRDLIRRRRKANGVSSRNQVLSRYRNNAKVRGYSWGLSDKQVFDLFSQPCAYCGAAPGNVFHSRHSTGDFIYSGIDRVDNNRGYEPDNVVPCCGTCNKAKHTMGEEELLESVARVYRHRELYKELI